ncbi:MAG: tRNA pseudouridine(38-40) synthase TruA [Alphaproteobacteria bacterium]|nr:tRNA pseudouridine(38-40) synthase TruA [Alphaproteobacteria bacterium]
MIRYKIIIEYDGTPFCGWQEQDEVKPSIQGSLQEAASHFLPEKVTMFGAGRTDAGVHAWGQVAHFDTEKEMTPYQVCQAFNAWLRPLPIAVVGCEIVNQDFHARFSAKKRFYEYRILNRRARPALEVNRVWHVPVPLDAEKMNDAAQIFLGEHDFTTFRASQCQAKSPIKTLDQFDIKKQGDYIICTLSARSFLHHQVRNLVGTLKLVGEGVWDKDRVVAALEARDRKAGGPTAPAEGLYFVKVKY